MRLDLHMPSWYSPVGFWPTSGTHALLQWPRWGRPLPLRHHPPGDGVPRLLHSSREAVPHWPTPPNTPPQPGLNTSMLGTGEYLSLYIAFSCDNLKYMEQVVSCNYRVWGVLHAWCCSMLVSFPGCRLGMRLAPCTVTVSFPGCRLGMRLAPCIVTVSFPGCRLGMRLALCTVTVSFPGYSLGMRLALCILLLVCHEQALANPDRCQFSTTAIITPSYSEIALLTAVHT